MKYYSINVVLLISFCLISTVKPGSIPFKECEIDGKTPIFTPDIITLEPIEPVIGESFTLEIKGFVDEKVDGGKFSVEVDLLVDLIIYEFYLQVYKEESNLCDVIDCPVEPGPTEIVYTKDLPSATPSGHYKIKVQAVSSDERPLMCFDLEFDIVKGKASIANEAIDFKTT